MERIATGSLESSPERAYSCYSVCSTSCDNQELRELLCYDRHILLAVDGTEDSCSAAKWALSNVYRPGDMLHLLHVIPEPDTLHQWPGLYAPPDASKETQEFMDAEALVKTSYVPLLAGAEVPFDAHIVIAPQDAGAITAVIVQHARALGAALVVAAAHHKSRLQELWRGSVTKSLITSGCPCPVCVITAEAAAGH